MVLAVLAFDTALTLTNLTNLRLALEDLKFFAALLQVILPVFE